MSTPSSSESALTYQQKFILKPTEQLRDAVSKGGGVYAATEQRGGQSPLESLKAIQLPKDWTQGLIKDISRRTLKTLTIGSQTIKDYNMEKAFRSQTLID